MSASFGFDHCDACLRRPIFQRVGLPQMADGCLAAATDAIEFLSERLVEFFHLFVSVRRLLLLRNLICLRLSVAHGGITRRASLRQSAAPAGGCHKGYRCDSPPYDAQAHRDHLEPLQPYGGKGIPPPGRSLVNQRRGTPTATRTVTDQFAPTSSTCASPGGTFPPSKLGTSSAGNTVTAIPCPKEAIAAFHRP